MNPMLFFGTLLLIFFFAGIRIVYEYKRALKFRFGKYVKTLQPGFRWIIPIVETIQKVDIRVITVNILSQEVMTEDNVPCSIDGVVFFKIEDPEKAVLEVEEYDYAISQLSQAALRDVCGKVELDTILSKREEMGKNIKHIVEQEGYPVAGEHAPDDGQPGRGRALPPGTGDPGPGRGTGSRYAAGGRKEDRPVPFRHQAEVISDPL